MEFINFLIVPVTWFVIGFWTATTIYHAYEVGRE